MEKGKLSWKRDMVFNTLLMLPKDVDHSTFPQENKMLLSPGVQGVGTAPNLQVPPPKHPPKS